MAITNPNKLINVSELKYFEGKLALKYQGKAISIEGINATTVEGALAELKGAIAGSDVDFEKLETPNTGMLATYRFTKGSGASAKTMDIDIEKDHMRAIVGFVTITESGGKYYDGATEVTADDGVTHAGVYLKSSEIDASGTALGIYKYADASAVIEYLTVGDQTGKAVTLTISNNQITADIADGAIGKAKLATAVQNSLGLADTAYQKPTGGIPAADLAESYKTQQTAVVSPTAEGNATAFIDTISQNANGEITATKKTIPSASASAAGLMSSADFSKLAALPSNDDLTTALGNKKDKQTAVTDPTAGSTPGLAFIATISQNANGEITATKENIQAASASQNGVMSAAHYSKLEAIAYAADSDIDEIFA